MTGRSPVIAWIAAALFVLTLAGCGGGAEARDYREQLEEVSKDARKATVGFLVTANAVRDPKSRDIDPEQLDRLAAGIARRRAEVTELVAELRALKPPRAATDAHAALIAAVQAKAAALVEQERAADDDDLERYEQLSADSQAADEQEAQARSELAAEGVDPEIEGEIYGGPEPESDEVRDQKRRIYEVSVDNALRAGVEASEDSGEANDAVGSPPEGAGLAGLEEPFATEADAREEGVTDLEAISAPPAIEELHERLITSQRDRAEAARQVSDAGAAGDAPAYTSSITAYGAARDAETTVATELEERSWDGFVLLVPSGVPDPDETVAPHVPEED